jgi:toxin YoeB
VECLYDWQGTDKKKAKRINDLIRDIERNGNESIGKPEALKHEWNGYWNIRIVPAVYDVLTARIKKCVAFFRAGKM